MPESISGVGRVGKAQLPGKTADQSRTVMTELVLPNDANTRGNILGGKVMHLVDLAAAMAASRHCRRSVVTASVDSLVFLHPIRVGEIVVLEATVNRAFSTSMEVQVEVCSEEALSGKRLKTSLAYLTFVALDEKGRPARVPPLVPVTSEQKRRYREATRRRKRRLQKAEQAQRQSEC